jgi:putative transcriptional regulator
MLEELFSTLQRLGWSIIDFSSKSGMIKVFDCNGNEQDMALNLSSKSFDYIIKKDDMSAIVKVIDNIDNFSKDKCAELANIARIFDAVPLIIGTKNRNGNLEDNILYNHYNVNAVNPSTFVNVIERKEYPRVYSKRGGYFVQLKPQEFKQLRQSFNLSLNDIANKLDVTPKAVYEYEASNMKTRLSHFQELAKIFKKNPSEFMRDFTETIDVFVKLYEQNSEMVAALTEFQKQIDKQLVELGFVTYWFNRSPIDMTFEEQGEEGEHRVQARPVVPGTKFLSETSSFNTNDETEELKKDIQKVERKLEQHVDVLKKFSQLLDSRSNFIVLLDDKLFEKRTTIHGVPIIHQDEIPSDAEKLKKIIFERKSCE